MYQIRIFTGVRIWWNIGRSPGSWRTKAGHPKEEAASHAGSGNFEDSKARPAQSQSRVQCSSSSKRGASWTTPLSQFSVPTQHSTAQRSTKQRGGPAQRPGTGPGSVYIAGRRVHGATRYTGRDAPLHRSAPGTSPVVIIQCAICWVGPPLFPSESC